jgi:hypothetical protein
MHHKIKSCVLTVGVLFCGILFAKAAEPVSYKPSSSYILHESAQDAFPLVAKGKAASIYVDSADWKVSGVTSQIVEKGTYPSKGALLIGTIGKSKIIDQLIANKELDVSAIKGHWESYLIQTVHGNLVVVGSDKRGTIYGIYDISEKIGVSPWYFWADVPVKKAMNCMSNRVELFRIPPK